MSSEIYIMKKSGKQAYQEMVPSFLRLIKGSHGPAQIHPSPLNKKQCIKLDMTCPWVSPLHDTYKKHCKDFVHLYVCIGIAWSLHDDSSPCETRYLRETIYWHQVWGGCGLERRRMWKCDSASGWYSALNAVFTLTEGENVSWTDGHSACTVSTSGRGRCSTSWKNCAL